LEQAAQRYALIVQEEARKTGVGKRRLVVPMTKLADVVFCVDCDRNLETYRSALGPEGDTASSGPQRRMAVKKDANGDPLCVPCMDSRRAKRNAAFLVRTGRAQDPDQPAKSHDAASGEPPARLLVRGVASTVRIPGRTVVEWSPKVSPTERVQRVPSSAGRSRSVAKAKKKAAADSGRSARPKLKISKPNAALTKPAKPERVSGPEARRLAARNELAFRRFVYSVGIRRAETLLREIKRGIGS
jgi:hypothetical protein